MVALTFFGDEALCPLRLQEITGLHSAHWPFSELSAAHSRQDKAQCATKNFSRLLTAVYKPRVALPSVLGPSYGLELPNLTLSNASVSAEGIISG